MNAANSVPASTNGDSGASRLGLFWATWKSGIIATLLLAWQLLRLRVITDEDWHSAAVWMISGKCFHQSQLSLAKVQSSNWAPRLVVACAHSALCRAGVLVGFLEWSYKWPSSFLARGTATTLLALPQLLDDPTLWLRGVPVVLWKFLVAVSSWCIDCPDGDFVCWFFTPWRLMLVVVIGVVLVYGPVMYVSWRPPTLSASELDDSSKSAPQVQLNVEAGTHGSLNFQNARPLRSTAVANNRHSSATAAPARINWSSTPILGRTHVNWSTTPILGGTSKYSTPSGSSIQGALTMSSTDGSPDQGTAMAPGHQAERDSTSTGTSPVVARQHPLQYPRLIQVCPYVHWLLLQRCRTWHTQGLHQQQQQKLPSRRVHII